MATIQTRQTKKGKSYQIVWGSGSQRRIISFPFGYTRRQILELKELIEEILLHNKTGCPLSRHARLLLSSDDALSNQTKDKLVHAGLVEFSEEEDNELKHSITIAELWERFKTENTGNLRPITIRNYQSVITTLSRYVPATTKTTAISEKKAQGIIAKMTAEGFSRATISTVLKNLRSLYKWGITAGLLGKDDNVWLSIALQGWTNKQRESYLTLDDYERLASVANNKEKALLSVLRLGGLRAGEALLLDWSDIDWKLKCALVSSPKTSNHEGGENRRIPLFPPLRRALQAFWEENGKLGKGSVFQFSNNAQATRMILAIVKRAKMKPWERLLQTLRVSASIDIYNKYGEIAEEEWLGHTNKIAKKHYLHLTQDTFKQAVEEL